MNTLFCRRAAFTTIESLEFEDLQFMPFDSVLTFADGTAVTEQIETSACSFYNDEFLFIIFSGKYDQLRLSNSLLEKKKTELLWEQSDVYEVFVGKNIAATKRYKEFQLSPDGLFFDSAINLAEGKSDHLWSSGMKGVSFTNMKRKIWRSIFALPWKSLDSAVGDTNISINLYRASGKFHGDELLAWSPTGYGKKCFHRPEKFGMLQFVE